MSTVCGLPVNGTELNWLAFDLLNSSKAGSSVNWKLSLLC